MFHTLLALCIAAPAPTIRPEEYSGTYQTMMESPVLVSSWLNESAGKIETETHWLVFLNAADEAKFIEFREGEYVFVTGRKKSGGKFKYIIVESFVLKKASLNDLLFENFNLVIYHYAKVALLRFAR